MAGLKRLESVNILKCIAILMVLTVHQCQLFKGCGLYELSKLGQLGCQCFFVISGYTLCQSWDYRKSTVMQFYNRRFMAIAPGYYFDIILFSLISIIVQYWNIPHYWHEGNSTIPGMGHVLNICFVHGLSPDSINSIVPGGWYIGTIMLMYLTFPIMKKLLEAVHSKNSYAVLILPGLCTLISMLFWYFIMERQDDMTIGNNTFVYFNILTQYPCFIIGGALYTFTTTHGYLTKRRSSINCGILTIIFATATILLFYSERDFLFCLVPACSASFFACVLLLIIKIVDIDRIKLPTSIQKIMYKISGVSYEMYLLHTLFAYFITWYIRKLLIRGGMETLFNNSLVFIVFLIVAILLSYYSGKLLKKFLANCTNLIYKTRKSGSNE